MRRLLILLVLGGTALGAGCATDGYGTYSVSGTYYAQPELAYVRPGVYVLRDWNEPVFYTGNLYWRYYNNRWYRSPYYDRGWVYAQPPRVLYGIRPYAYVRYRPSYRYNVQRDYRYRPDYRYRRYDGRYYRY